MTRTPFPYATNRMPSPSSVSAIVTRVITICYSLLLPVRRSMVSIDRDQLFRLGRGMFVSLQRNRPIGIALQLGALRIVDRGVLLFVPLLKLIHVPVAAFLGQHR